MILSAIFVVLILAIAFTQATHGFFSALMMTVLTICCCAAAFGMHEWLAANALAPYWKPDFAHPLALGVTFGLSLLVLRMVFDKLIRRVLLLPAWMDRLGGGVCGIVTGLVMVGVMAVCVQMLPFGGPFLGYQRVPVVRRGPGAAGKLQADAPQRELWLRPDRFAAATASLVSSGAFGGPRNFFKENPDFVTAAGWVNSAPAGVSRFAKPRSIKIVNTEPVQFLYRQIPGSERERTPTTYEPLDAKGDRELRLVRVGLLQQARDERKTHAFTLRQFRLVGENDGLPAQYHPIAVQQEDASQTTNRHIRFIKESGGDMPLLDEPMTTRGSDDEVEVVFELPKGFEPSFLEYKRGSRVAVSFDAGRQTRRSEPAAPAEPTPSGTPAAAERPASGAVPDSGRGGNVRRVTTQAGRSFFGDQLPMELKAYRKAGNTEVSRNTLVHGHLVGEVGQQAAGSDPPVTKFAVPEGKRLLHLNTGFLEARSGLGRALSRAVAIAQNYTVMDDRGNPYPIAGKYAIADVNGTRVVEVQFAPDENALMGGGLGPFERVKDDHLKGDYQLVMLFAVNPGVKIVSFSTGGDATRKDDLTAENLTAPP
jgi:hypothetical protein